MALNLVARRRRLYTAPFLSPLKPRTGDASGARAGGRVSGYYENAVESDYFSRGGGLGKRTVLAKREKKERIEATIILSGGVVMELTSSSTESYSRS